MRTTKTLKPGQKGTKELLTQFGPSLLLVRYRYDEEHRENLKTVELVVQRRSRDREAECRRSRPADGRCDGASTRRVALRVGWREREVQQRVKSAGGRWDRDRRVWILGRGAAERLKLLERVVGDGGRG